MQRRERVILQKIISEIDVGSSILGETSYEDFVENEMMKRAICMTVINIGELTKSLNEETRTKYPKILWKDIAAMRNVAAHKYETLTLKTVYETAKTNFPELKLQLEEILK